MCISHSSSCYYGGDPLSFAAATGASFWFFLYLVDRLHANVNASDLEEQCAPPRAAVVHYIHSGALCAMYAVVHYALHTRYACTAYTVVHIMFIHE